MIASALRAEIQNFILSDPDQHSQARLARLALNALAERSQAGEDRATLLACQALCESLGAHVEGRSFDGFEATLDAIDDLVPDPAQLPLLRKRLWLFMDHIKKLSQETTSAPRRQPVLHLSAV